MSDISETTGKLKQFLDIVDKDMEEFKCSAEVIAAQEGKGAVSVTFKHFYALAALSGVDLYVKGGTGPGKTNSVEGFMRSVFGDERASTNMSNSFSQQMLYDVDMDKMAKVGVAASVTPGPLLTKMAVRIDEFNRVHPQAISGTMEAWLTKDSISGPGGRELRAGVLVKDGKMLYGKNGKPMTFDDAGKEGTEGAHLWQWAAGLCNSGEGFDGTFSTDRATVDRFGMTLNIDDVMLTDEDRDTLYGEGKRYSPKPVNQKTASKATALLLEIAQDASSIPISQGALEFVKFLSKGDACPKSRMLHKNVEGFKTTDKRYCEGCNAAAAGKNMCGHVHAPSPRALLELEQVARVYVLFRLMENAKGRAEVLVDDIKAVAPYVLAGRMKMDENYALEIGEGSVSYAVTAVIDHKYQQMTKALGEYAPIKEAEANGVALTSAQETRLIRILEQTPALASPEQLKALSTILRNRERTKSTNTS